MQQMKWVHGLAAGLILAGAAGVLAQGTISAAEPGGASPWAGLEGPVGFPGQEGLLGSGDRRPPPPPPGFHGFVFASGGGSYELADLHLGPPPGRGPGPGGLPGQGGPGADGARPPMGGMLRVGDKAYLLKNLQMTPYPEGAADSAGRSVVATFQAELAELPPPPAPGAAPPASMPELAAVGMIQGTLVRVGAAAAAPAPARGPGQGMGLVVEATVQTSSTAGTLLARGGPGHRPFGRGRRPGQESIPGGS